MGLVSATKEATDNLEKADMLWLLLKIGKLTGKIEPMIATLQEAYESKHGVVIEDE